MKCPSCGRRTPASLANCAHCDAYIDGANQRSQPSLSHAHSEETNSNPWQAHAENSGHQVVSGKTMMAILAGFVILGGIVFVVVPMYHESMGHEAHYRVLWCTSTSGLTGTDPDEIRAQGFSSVARMAPGYSRLGDESTLRVQCFSKDYGQERPSYRNADNSREYRAVSTYYSAPDEPEEGTVEQGL